MVKSVIDRVTTLYVSNVYQVKAGVVTKYYPGGAFRVGGVLYYSLTDHLGSTSITIDTDGNKTETRYKAWGEVRYTSGSALLTDKTYTGQRSFASDFGLMYYNARWYDSSVGRFAQADNIDVKVGDTQSLERFAYVSNNPILYNDPTGHSVNPPCFICDRTLYYYDDSLGGVAINFASTVMCWFIGCHNHSGIGGGYVEGPSSKQAALMAVTSVGMPLAAVTNPIEGEIANYAEASVCRAGTCLAEQFSTGTGVKMEADGTLSGVSVTTAPGKSVQELTELFNNKRVGVTSGGEIGEAGGTLVLDPTLGNPYHAMVNGLTPQELEDLFSPTILNPNKIDVPR